MKHNKMKEMFEALSLSENVQVLSVIWLVAMLSLMYGVTQIPSFMHASKNAENAKQAETKLIQASVTSESMQPQELESIKKRVNPLHQGIVLNTTNNTLEVIVQDIRQYMEWRLAVDDVLASAPQYDWKIDSLCAGEACQPQGYQVKLSAMRKVVKVQ